MEVGHSNSESMDTATITDRNTLVYVATVGLVVDYSTNYILHDFQNMKTV